MSWSLTPVARRTVPLKMRERTRRLAGSRRSTFQPTTTSRPSSILAMKAGRSAGSSWRSASMVMTISPRARWKPAERAMALPKFLRRRTPCDARVLAWSARDHRPGVVGAAVVDEDESRRRAPAVEALADALRQLGEALALVEAGDHDRDVRRFEGGVALAGTSATAGRTAASVGAISGSSASWAITGAQDSRSGGFASLAFRPRGARQARPRADPSRRASRTVASRASASSS